MAGPGLLPALSLYKLMAPVGFLILAFNYVVGRTTTGALVRARGRARYTTGLQRWIARNAPALLSVLAAVWFVAFALDVRFGREWGVLHAFAALGALIVSSTAIRTKQLRDANAPEDPTAPLFTNTDAKLLAGLIGITLPGSIAILVLFLLLRDSPTFLPVLIAGSVVQSLLVLWWLRRHVRNAARPTP